MVGLCNDSGLNNYKLVDNLIYSKYKENSVKISVNSNTNMITCQGESFIK